MFAFYICGLLLLLFGVYIGFAIGSSLGERAETNAEYWKMNAAAIVVAVLLSFILSGLPLLYGAIIGLLAGCIAGLKMSFGESTGPWAVLDRFFNINKGHRESTEKGTGAARRRRKRTGEKEPDLISVSGDRSSGRGADANHKKDAR